jgi:tetratricopeptide (TPR) repeat protein
VISELNRQAAVPLANQASAEERLQRARTLAMLGRSEAALAVLDLMTDPVAEAEADNLRGTIYENRGQWEAGLAAYAQARDAWDAQPHSAGRTAGLLQAATGMAYCLRKAGRYAEAEATYHQVLALAPTADTHFLLAQFYEDAQQADQARQHARQAMALDPRSYQQLGNKLINKLVVHQFGCLGVFRGESGQLVRP